MLYDCDLGKKIRDLRIKKNLSQDRFGYKIGVSGKSISAYENGICKPSLKVLENISNTYDASFISDSKRDYLVNKLNSIKTSLKEIEEYLEKSLSL